MMTSTTISSIKVKPRGLPGDWRRKRWTTEEGWVDGVFVIGSVGLEGPTTKAGASAGWAASCMARNVAA
jgi:hypothetical protein